MDIKEVAKYLNKQVEYNRLGVLEQYKLNACILRKRNNKFYYTAELLDKNKNSVTIVSLDKVLLVEKDSNG